MSLELTQIKASQSSSIRQGEATDSPGGVAQEGPDRLALPGTDPPTTCGSAPEVQTQIQELAEAASRPQLLADTLTSTSSSETLTHVEASSGDAVAQHDATHKPSPRLHRLWTTASEISSVQPASWLGVTFDHEDSDGKRTWVIKITKLGLWFVALHLLLAAGGIFNIVTTIYSWTSNNNSDEMLQRILKNVADS